MWEIPQRALLDLAIARGPYICQSQSLNVYMAEANFSKMTSMHFYAWKKGLKTGQYYLRTRPSRDAIKFTVDIEQLLQATDSGNNEEILKCLNLTKEGNLKGMAATNKDDQKRDDRYMSISKGGDDDVKPADDQSSTFNAQEVEDVVFECINCSG